MLTAKKNFKVFAVIAAMVVISSISACGDDDDDSADLTGGDGDTDTDTDGDADGDWDYDDDDDDDDWGGDTDTDADTDGDTDGDSDSDSDGDTDTDVEDNYGELVENPWVDTGDEPVSTFSIDVDTASYSLVRNYLMNYDSMPPVDNVRIEELVNYFDYEYPQPEGDLPFSVTMEMAQSPWREDANLVMFGLQGKDIDPESVPPSNLTFLIDVSGSMSASNKLPLLKEAFKLLVERLSEKDSVSIVTYAGSAGILLDSVSGDQTAVINNAIDSLSSGGSTAGAEGIITAYELAEQNLDEDGNNRVILATDGDFNVGMSSESELEDLIVEEREKGIFITVLGFGMGNVQDSMMETIADAGNGNYFYIDTMNEAEKVFVHDLLGNMFTIAKDVKLQVEFNPERIEKYRLIGYENRVMPNEDFEDDSVDAGEIGAGHRVTAFYEVLFNVDGAAAEIEGDEDFEPVEFEDDEYLQLRMRYKKPDEDVSRLIESNMSDENVSDEMSLNLGFASSVVEFGMLVRDSEFKEASSYDSAYARAQANLGDDEFGYRAEFLEIVQKAKQLDQ